jgi:ribosomal-protein-alanine N-acetyltransferase
MMLRVADIFGRFPQLETERLILRKMRKDDARDLYAYASDPDVARHTLWNAHRSLLDSQRFLEAVIEQYKSKEVTNWGIEHKADRKFIGTCGFVYWNPDHRRAEIGYALSKSYWNQGIMSEAAHAVMQFGFKKMLLNRLEARCNVENIGSERVMQKIGMTYEGTIREQLLIRGKFEDVKLYSILRSEVSLEC